MLFTYWEIYQYILFMHGIKLQPWLQLCRRLGRKGNNSIKSGFVLISNDGIPVLSTNGKIPVSRTQKFCCVIVLRK